MAASDEVMPWVAKGLTVLVAAFRRWVEAEATSRHTRLIKATLEAIRDTVRRACQATSLDAQ